METGGSPVRQASGTYRGQVASISSLHGMLPIRPPRCRRCRQSAYFFLRSGSGYSHRVISCTWHKMCLSPSCMRRSCSMYISIKRAYPQMARVLTRRFVKSLAFGLDARHRVIDKKGSDVPEHSALTLCRVSDSRSMLILNASFMESTTKLVCSSNQYANTRRVRSFVQLCCGCHSGPRT